MLSFPARRSSDLGIIAAATTSLPEDFGGVRNWDYRYCWLRDAALSLETLLTHGHVDAAVGWREWLLRAIAGDPEQLQIMYSIVGSRNLPEQQLAHLPGYEGSRSEEHTSELQSRGHLVCRLLLEKKKYHLQ